MQKISFLLTIENQLTEISKVINHFETFAKDHSLNRKLVSMISISFDELLNNTISYGYTDEELHEIKVKVEIKTNNLIISISDDGIPFNPFDNSPPNTDLSLEKREVGGLGIHIVKTIMDELDYKRSNDLNIITITKKNIFKKSI